MNNLSVFSFFSGAGFLDLGFEMSDFKICFVNELKPSFLSAYRYSREVLHLPVPKYGYSADNVEIFLSGEPLNRLKRQIEQERSSKCLVGFIGGPPCPDFSVGGKNRGRHGDNGRLSGIYANLICQCKPDFFVFENVKGLWRTKQHRLFFEELKCQFQASDYLTTESLLNAIEFGVPQDRERIILFGIRNELLSSKDDIKYFNWNKKKIYDKEEVLNRKWPGKNTNSSILPPNELTVDYWFNKNKVDMHQNSKDCFVPRAGIKKFMEIDEGDDSKKSYKRLHRNRYAPTMCFGNNEVHIHPTQPRRISVSEALALQSMPKEFVLPPDMTLTDKFKTTGNGVPYLLSKGIAETIRDFLLNYAGGQND